MNSIFVYSLGQIGIAGWLTRGLAGFTGNFQFLGEQGAIPQQVLVLMGLLDDMNGCIKAGHVLDLLKLNGMVTMVGNKLTPQGQALLNKLNPVGIGAQPITSDEAERKVIDATFDNFVSVLQNKETEKGIAVFEPEAP
jgi:hypothetical protein